MKRALILVVAFLWLGDIVHSLPAGAAETQPSRQMEWEKTVAAARKEGALTVYVWLSGNMEKAVETFQKKYPEIRLTTVSGRGSSFIVRIASEMRAGKYLADVCICGVTSPYKVFYKNRFLDPINSALVLPEVIDESKWWQGKHHYQDGEGRYIFVFMGNPAGARVYYNKNLVNPSEFNSYWDILTPRWKGKIVAIDPNESSGGWRQLYYNPGLGPNYIRRLLVEMEPSVSRDERQATDWLAQGKFALSFFSRGVSEAKTQGLPVDEFLDSHFKEPLSISSGANGTIALMNGAPHPNAAKVFINWFLSREGQTTLQELMNTPLDQVESMREDIPKDPVPPEYRRRKGVNYIPMFTAERMESGPVLKLYNEIVKR